MSATLPGFLERLRQPEYTGENRCLPCTVVNAIIAGALAAAATLLVTPVGGGVVLVLSLAAIYLRGYLVPGTPELTKRYLPDRVLRLFDKAPDLPDPGETVDVEGYLLDAGVLEAVMLNPEGYVAECTGDNICIVRERAGIKGELRIRANVQ